MLQNLLFNLKMKKLSMLNKQREFSQYQSGNKLCLILQLSQQSMHDNTQYNVYNVA